MAGQAKPLAPAGPFASQIVGFGAKSRLCWQQWRRRRRWRWRREPTDSRPRARKLEQLAVWKFAAALWPARRWPGGRRPVAGAAPAGAGASSRRPSQPAAAAGSCLRPICEWAILLSGGGGGAIVDSSLLAGWRGFGSGKAAQIEMARRNGPAGCKQQASWSAGWLARASRPSSCTSAHRPELAPPSTSLGAHVGQCWRLGFARGYTHTNTGLAGAHLAAGWQHAPKVRLPPARPAGSPRPDRGQAGAHVSRPQWPGGPADQSTGRPADWPRDSRYATGRLDVQARQTGLAEPSRAGRLQVATCNRLADGLAPGRRAPPISRRVSCHRRPASAARR